jgi:hypothetical protein
MGSLVNITVDNEPVQSEVLECGAIPRILELVELSQSKIAQVPPKQMDDDEKDDFEREMGVYSHILTSSLRVLNNLTEIEKGIRRFMDCQGLSSLIGLLKEQHFIILNEAGEKDEDEVMEALERLENITAVLETIGEDGMISYPISVFLYVMTLYF